MPITKNGSFTDFDDGSSASASVSSDNSPSAASTSSNSERSLTSSSSSNNDPFGHKSGEGCALRTSRLLFFVVLLGAAGFLGWGVYRSTSNEEIDDFETTFKAQSNELFVGSDSNVRKSIQALASLSTSMTAFMHYQKKKINIHNDGDNNNNDNNDAPPPPGFITLPDVEQQFSSIRNATGALVIAYMPLISSYEEVEKWNDYSKANQEWISESNGGGVDTKPILPTIWKYAANDDDGERHNRKLTTIDNGGEDCEGILHYRGRSRRNLYKEDAQEVEEEEEDRRVPVSAVDLVDDPLLFASPVWTLSPPPPPNDTDIINYNLSEKLVFKKAVKFIQKTKEATFLDVCNQAKWFGNDGHADELQTVIAYPVFDDYEKSNIVGHLTAIIPWRVFFEGILHGDETTPVTIVMENTCGEVFTLEIMNQHVSVINPEKDTHDTHYDYIRGRGSFAEFANGKPKQPTEEELLLPNDEDNNIEADEHCAYFVNAYPTQEFEDHYLTSTPKTYTVIVLCVVLSTAMVFVLFDCLAKRHQDKIIKRAMKQSAIVSSLFPKKIQEKMLAEVDHQTGRLSAVGKAGIKTYLKDDAVSGGDAKSRIDKSKPIADLFPETTIMFADLAGFTAWSSAREPTMVFTLLETLYHFFDATAKRRRVFKVETIGDCYVAVTGLPDPRKDHAVAMARFAHECLKEMSNLLWELEVELGPETADLKLRVGLHSGPVVAGVLRGEKSRFQLFGDTMNTASRMESTGFPGRIQISQETADYLLAAGKEKWITPREDKVKAKGKGELSTYWLEPGGGDKASGSKYVGSRSVCSLDVASVDSGKTGDFISLDDFQLRESEENRRIAHWAVGVLGGLLKEIEARRRANEVMTKERVKVPADAFNMRNMGESMKNIDVAVQNKKNQSDRWEKKLRRKHEKNGTTVIHEVEEIIMLPEFDAKAAKKEEKATDIELSDEVQKELRNYIMTIASMYNDNPFHNFAHANHVTMSVTKLLSRIVAPDVEQLEEGVNNKSLHDHTYGITSDPLTRFSVVLSALIHDVDHDGVSNMQLVKENTYASKLYNGKSVAEQNSVDVAWNLLMEPGFKHLRRHIYKTEAEFNRFRQLLINTVMATDIMDKDLKKLRNDRWDKAFSIPPDEEKKDPRAINRKATIVIEHLIQASDVAHTMQHWHIYRKWNERLFGEMYKAYKEGRMEKDPSTDWYKGEIGFFDFYIIPHAKKLASCGVFGVSSDEYLNYAQQNRKEWGKRGEEIVAEMVANVKRKYVGDVAFKLKEENVDPEGQKFVKKQLKNAKRRRADFLKRDLPLEISTEPGNELESVDGNETGSDCTGDLDLDNVDFDYGHDGSDNESDMQIAIKG